MGQAITSPAAASAPQGQVTNLGSAKLVVENVEVIRRREVINVPEIVRIEQPTIEYIARQEPTVKYNVSEVETIKYVPKESETVKYNVRQEETIKYVPHEVRCEKPVLIDTPYERPVVVNKEYVLVTFKDMEAIRELMSVAPALLEQLNAIRKYTLVEEIVRVPKVQYEPTKVERVVWEDKHRCKKCGDLIDGN